MKTAILLLLLLIPMVAAEQTVTEEFYFLNQNGTYYIYTNDMLPKQFEFGEAINLSFDVETIGLCDFNLSELDAELDETEENLKLYINVTQRNQEKRIQDEIIDKLNKVNKSLVAEFNTLDITSNLDDIFNESGNSIKEFIAKDMQSRFNSYEEQFDEFLDCVDLNNDKVSCQKDLNVTQIDLTNANQRADDLSGSNGLLWVLVIMLLVFVAAILMDRYGAKARLWKGAGFHEAEEK